MVILGNSFGGHYSVTDTFLSAFSEISNLHTSHKAGTTRNPVFQGRRRGLRGV